MKIFKMTFLIFVMILFFTENIYANTYQCKMEQLLDKTSLKYNLYFEETGVEGIDNFLNLYSSKKEVYTYIYDWLKKQPKTLLTCQNDYECDQKAKKLAEYATFTVTRGEKFDNFSLLLSQSANLVGDMMWNQAKDAYKISANTFLKPYAQTLEYLTNYVDYELSALNAYSENDTKENEIKKILMSLIPTLTNYIKDPFSFDNLSKMSEDIEKAANLFQGDAVASYAGMSKDLFKLLDDVQYYSLYQNAIDELKKGDSCIDTKWFTKREINYLANIPAYTMENIVLDTISVLKDISGFFKIKKLTENVDVITSNYDGVSWFKSEQRTQKSRILTFAGLVKNKLDYSDDDLRKFIKSINGIDLEKFTNALFYKNTDYINTFLANYNKNKTYFQNFYKKDVFDTRDNMLIGSAIKRYFLPSDFSVSETVMPVDTVWYENKAYINRIPLSLVVNKNGTERRDLASKVRFNISLWGNSTKSQNLYIDGMGFYEGSGSFVFNLKDAFHVEGTNLYYYKYFITDENSRPVYVYTKIPGQFGFGIRGNEFNYRNGKIYMRDNYGILLFKYDKQKAKFFKVINKYYPKWNGYVENKYLNITGLLKRISIKDFKDARDLFIEETVDKKYINLNANSVIQDLNNKLNEISKSSNYVPLWYAYEYFYSVNRVIQHKKINTTILKRLEDEKYRSKYFKMIRKYYPKILNQKNGYLRVHFALKAFYNTLYMRKGDEK